MTTALELPRTLSENESQIIAKNLNAVIKARNIQKNQIAQALGIPAMTVRRIFSGETTDPRISTLKLIADYLNISIDSLLDTKNQISINNSKKAAPYFAPILDWDTAARINSIHELDLLKWKEWQPISLSSKQHISENAFALISRPSMYPRFPQETIFIIDPNITPRDGDIILVRIKENNELTLRELKIDSPDWFLHPLISSSTPLIFSRGSHEIVGVNLLTLLYNRKSNE